VLEECDQITNHLHDIDYKRNQLEYNNSNITEVHLANALWTVRVKLVTASFCAASQKKKKLT